MKFRTSYGQNALKHSIEVAQLSGLLAAELGLEDVYKRQAGITEDIDIGRPHGHTFVPGAVSEAGISIIFCPGFQSDGTRCV